MNAGAFVNQHVQNFNNHDSAAWANDYSDDAVLSAPQYPQPLRGRDAIRKDIEDFFQAFPDVQFHVTNIVERGDLIAVEGASTGVHQGPIASPAGAIEATNKRVDLGFAVFMRTNAQGQILEERRYYDQATMMQQLGLMQ